MNPARKPWVFLQQLRKELRAWSDQDDGRSGVFVKNFYDDHFQQFADGLPECSEVPEEQPVLTARNEEEVPRAELERALVTALKALEDEKSRSKKGKGKK